MKRAHSANSAHASFIYASHACNRQIPSMCTCHLKENLKRQKNKKTTRTVILNVQNQTKTNTSCTCNSINAQSQFTGKTPLNSPFKTWKPELTMWFRFTLIWKTGFFFFFCTSCRCVRFLYDHFFSLLYLLVFFSFLRETINLAIDIDANTQQFNQKEITLRSSFCKEHNKL